MTQSPPSSSAAPLRLGIAGLGTVGTGVLRTLSDQGGLIAGRCPRPIEVTAVSARDRSKDRGVDISSLRWCEDPVDLARANDVDLVVELIGGADGPARDLVEAAIAAGKDVVTANKALLAVHGTSLAQAADRAGVILAYEAAVAGGIPIVKGLREGLAGNAVARITGILNGTCNYILTQMEETGRPFADVLADAQALGYAEADPTFDIGGFDAAHKITILASLAFGARVSFDDVHVEGITGIEADDILYAGELGYRIKLLALAEQTKAGISVRVHPALVALRTPLAEVGDVMNAVLVHADPVKRMFFEGPGAGEGPTASAVVADIMDLARGLRLPVYTTHADDMTDASVLPVEKREGAFYLRLKVIDRPGVIASITRMLADAKVSIESMLQRGRAPNEAVPIVIITHEATDAVMTDALERIAALDHVVETPCLIRIEAV